MLLFISILELFALLHKFFLPSVMKPSWLSLSLPRSTFVILVAAEPLVSWPAQSEWALIWLWHSGLTAFSGRLPALFIPEMGTHVVKPIRGESLIGLWLPSDRKHFSVIHKLFQDFWCAQRQPVRQQAQKKCTDGWDEASSVSRPFSR